MDSTPTKSTPAKSTPAPSAALKEGPPKPAPAAAASAEPKVPAGKVPAKKGLAPKKPAATPATDPAPAAPATTLASGRVSKAPPNKDVKGSKEQSQTQGKPKSKKGPAPKKTPAPPQAAPVTPDSLKDASAEPAEVIKCICGDSEADLAMVECETCHTWQHVVCLGFENGEDKRIPDVYVCFPCQIAQDATKPQPYDMQQIRGLATWRRTLSVLRNEQLKSPEVMSRRLSISVAEVKEMNERLEREGFISKRPNVTDPSFLKCYEVIQTAEVKARLTAYFPGDCSAPAMERQVLGYIEAPAAKGDPAPKPTGMEKPTEKKPPSPSNKKGASAKAGMKPVAKRNAAEMEGADPTPAKNPAAAGPPQPRKADEDETMTEDSLPARPLTPKSQMAPASSKTAGLDEKLNKMGLAETTPAHVPPFLSQYGLVSQSQSQEVSQGGGSSEERPKKVRKVSVVSKPLQL